MEDVVQNILIVGGGFAGVWSALAAAGARERLGRGPSDVRITLVSRDPHLTIRPRLYEPDPDRLRVPLNGVFGGDRVELVVGEVTGIDTKARTATVQAARGLRLLTYDRLILAAGSRLERPNITGAAVHAHSVDTLGEAVALDQHLTTLPSQTSRAARFTVIVVGAGFTGLEVATQLVERLGSLAARSGAVHELRVVLVEREGVVAPDLGPASRSVIETALRDLGIEVRLGAPVAEVGADGVRLGTGEWIAAATTVWTGGLRASALAGQLGVERDALGRVPVDEYLRVRGVEGVFAAGDLARAMADPEHAAPMSCQLAIPMGECAGRNAVSELLDVPLVAFSWPNYVTCLDLGPWGALFTEGWDRQVRLTGFWAKVMKETINGRLIYPPVAPGTPGVGPAPGLEGVRAA
jgi:NADH:ubiquinone reductase (H+-translocating)